MSYARIAATASAARYIEQREAEDRAAMHRRNSAAMNKMMDCGLTCAEWLERYHAKRNRPAKVVEHNTETDHDDQDRREVAGTEARPGGAGEGLGDAAPQQSQGEAGGEAICTEAGWSDEAWPSSEGASDDRAS